MTLRGHTSALLSMTGPCEDKVLFTSDAEGMIRVWNMPEPNNDEKFPTTNGRNYCVALLNDSVNEPVW
jgi:WD40 repeat protein